MDPRTADFGGRPSPSRPGRRILHRLEGPGSALSFWGAVSLPLLYLPLVASGIDTRAGLGLFVGLFALQLLALIGGRNHRLDR